MIKFQFYTKRITVILFSVFLFFSCDKDDDAQPVEVTINDWIFDVMDDVYYWTDQLPQNSDKSQDPIDYFNSLVYTPEDRFSFISPSYTDLRNSLEGIELEAGYEFALIRESADNSNVLAAITYVKRSSPAEQSGLKRGDLISHVNNAQMTLDNYRELIGQMGSNHTITYRRYDVANEVYVEQGTPLTVVQFAENPSYLDTVYMTESGRKIGYYVYNFFSPGQGNSQVYDLEMDNIFSKFKNENINELILDLRYNGGGSVSSATNLASLIAPRSTVGQVFIETRWNDEYQEYFESRDDSDARLFDRFVNKTENIGDNLSRVFVLTSSRTASASELIINGLLPFMEVYTIGDQSYGKNVGSVLINDDENINNDYALLPIVFKSFNANGTSDFSNGFIPSPANQIEDFQFPMKQLGDISEPLLARAIGFIEGEGGARLSYDQTRKEKLLYSQDLKLRSNRSIFEK